MGKFGNLQMNKVVWRHFYLFIFELFFTLETSFLFVKAPSVSSFLNSLKASFLFLNLATKVEKYIKSSSLILISIPLNLL